MIVQLQGLLGMTIKEHCRIPGSNNGVPSEISHLVSNLFEWYEVIDYSSCESDIDLRYFQEINNIWVEVNSFSSYGSSNSRIVLKERDLSGGGGSFASGAVKRFAQQYINKNAQLATDGMGMSLAPKEDGTKRTFENDSKELFDYSTGEEKGSNAVKASAAAAVALSAAMMVTSKGKSVFKDPDTLKTIKQGFTGKLKGKDVKIDDVPIKQVDYKKRNSAERIELVKAAPKAKKTFNKSLVDSPEKIADLKDKGLSDADIKKLQKGRPPAGYQAHHKLPLDDGGTNDQSNFALTKNDPFHKVFTNEQNSLTKGLQTGDSKIIEFPVPKGNLYPPVK